MTSSIMHCNAVKTIPARRISQDGRQLPPPCWNGLWPRSSYRAPGVVTLAKRRRTCCLSLVGPTQYHESALAGVSYQAFTLMESRTFCCLNVLIRQPKGTGSAGVTSVLTKVCHLSTADERCLYDGRRCIWTCVPVEAMARLQEQLSPRTHVISFASPECSRRW